MIASGQEVKHKYGKNYHILSDTFLTTILALLSTPRVKQPFLTHLMRILYHGLLSQVIENEFPRKKQTVKTRMYKMHKQAVLRGDMIDFGGKVISVNFARAGIVPSQLCYEFLNDFFNPSHVRQDHLYIQRMTDVKGSVTGSHVGGYKIGGPINKTIMLIPDPMGATGGSICEGLNLYREKIPGKALKWIALHIIVTPEYLMRVKKEHPNLIVYALRLDRGLSSAKVLQSIPGTHWSQEKGLNKSQYIVPGAGGLGELLNNSFV